MIRYFLPFLLLLLKESEGRGSSRRSSRTSDSSVDFLDILPYLGIIIPLGISLICGFGCGCRLMVKIYCAHQKAERNRLLRQSNTDEQYNPQTNLAFTTTEQQLSSDVVRLSSDFESPTGYDFSATPSAPAFASMPSWGHAPPANTAPPQAGGENRWSAEDVAGLPPDYNTVMRSGSTKP